MKTETLTFSALEAAKAVRNGEITCEELVQACLDRIEEFDGEIGAWAHLSAEHALTQARQADKFRRLGRGVGPLHGVPVGIKDIIDTKDFPTEQGSPIHQGRRPVEDATLVAKLREAGAIILGKTVTTEFAVMHPGKTVNPHDTGRTPGGSSSGSAAAVAAKMVPLAVGTQTNGSVIRPAAFCGVVGYKPTYGLISRHRVLRQSPPLDQIGVFANSVEDAGLMAQAMMGYDDRDEATRPQASPDLWRLLSEDPPMTPRLGFVKGPVWNQAEDSTKEAFAELVDFLGETAEEAEIAPVFDEVIDLHRMVMEADLAKNIGPNLERAPDQVSKILTEMIVRGREVKAVAYNLAIDRIKLLPLGLDELFETYDAIITPATAGEAPKGLETTGSPAFCTLWTFCGMPAITLPILSGAEGLPLGVQLVGRKGEDGKLLRTARWLMEQVALDAAADA
ncbi:MAG: amidase [Limibacillus sp.]